MSKTAIVKSGENFFIKQLSKSQPIKLDRVIFANVSGINSNTDINADEKMPASNQIVHTAPVTQSGLLNDRTVVYSVILDTSVGDFSFNYIGLVNAETNTLCMVMHTDLTKKIKTTGQRQGNTITESIWLEMDNASESTGVTVNAQTWQIDYSKRLAGEDERIRLTNYDLYNRLVILNGFTVTKNNNQLNVSPGLAYVAGLRVENQTQKSIKVDNNQSLYIDAWLTGTVTGQWSVNYNLIAGTNLKDYDKDGFKHFVERIASVDANGQLKTVKTKSYLTSDDLSSKIDSIDENKAATSQAVKKAYDLASGAVKKSGDTMTGQLILPKEGLKINFDNNDVMALATSNDDYSHIFYNAQKKQWFKKLVYNSTTNRWNFQYIDDVTINNKSVLKTGDYGIGVFTGAQLDNPNLVLPGGCYATRTTAYPDMPEFKNRNDSGSLVVYPAWTKGWSVEKLAVVQGKTPRVFYRCSNPDIKQPFHEVITTANVNNYIPVGVPMPWPQHYPPAGWLECNGSTFDKNKYPKLAVAYPSGKLPDLRGEFIRGWDNARGVDPYRVILEWQQDAIRNIYGTFVGTDDNDHRCPPTGVFKSIGVGGSGTGGGSKEWIIEMDASRVVPVAHENRPRNIAFMYIVKAE